jgi:hypothetical protein
MNAQLAFENFRHLRLKYLCHEVFGKTECIKGKAGQVGSVTCVESVDKSRIFNLKMVSLNEQSLEVIFETLDYKEPAAHINCEHEGVHGEHVLC